MKRFLTAAAMAAAALTAGTGIASAAGGQVLCVGTPSGAVATPDSDGVCKKGTAVTLVAEGEVAALEARVGALQSANAMLQSEVAALEHKLSAVSYDATGLNGKPTVKIDGANLQIVDGSGETAGTTNGLGNLFIGYNETLGADRQTGSHSLVIGSSHTFTSFAGLVAGYNNTLTASDASALGSTNTASGMLSSVSGGHGNVASGHASSVSGGFRNVAGGYYSSILGGYERSIGLSYATSP